MNGKTWAIFAIVVAAVVGGMIYLSTQNRLNVSDISNDAAMRIIPAEARTGDIGEHTIGNANGKVVMIEYGDYQCPGCRTAAPEAKRVAEKYKDHVALVFRNYPIPSLHPNARAAAAVAEAAGLQGKFWEMHDLLYTNQGTWSNARAKERTDVFSGYAKQLGLNVDKFNADLASGAVTKKIDFDVAVGRQLQIDGTPTFFINGNKLNLGDASSIENAVKDALKKAGVAVDKAKS